MIRSKFQQRRSTLMGAALVWMVVLLSPLHAGRLVLRPETIEAWDQYIQHVSETVAARTMPGATFLSVDESTELRLRAGEILAEPAAPQIPRKVPSGLIHDWRGAAFVPDATIDDVLRVARDYAHYKDIYKPVAIESSALSIGKVEDRFTVRLMNKSLLSKTAIDTTYVSSTIRLSPKRAYSVTRSTRIEEIENFGSASQQELPPDQGSGMLWRLYSVSRYEERDGGVYVEIEALGLSRDIPFSLHWMIEPMVRRVSRSSLTTSLEQTKDAVHTLCAHRRAAEIASGASAVSPATPKAK